MCLHIARKVKLRHNNDLPGIKGSVAESLTPSCENSSQAKSGGNFLLTEVSLMYLPTNSKCYYADQSSFKSLVKPYEYCVAQLNFNIILNAVTDDDNAIVKKEETSNGYNRDAPKRQLSSSDERSS